MTDLDVDAIVAAFRERGEVPTDTQAMALVKKFRPYLEMKKAVAFYMCGGSEDLNRAIVECVAKLKGAKL